MEMNDSWWKEKHDRMLSFNIELLILKNQYMRTFKYLFFFLLVPDQYYLLARYVEKEYLAVRNWK